MNKDRLIGVNLKLKEGKMLFRNGNWLLFLKVWVLFCMELGFFRNLFNRYIISDEVMKLNMIVVMIIWLLWVVCNQVGMNVQVVLVSVELMIVKGSVMYQGMKGFSVRQVKVILSLLIQVCFFLLILNRLVWNVIVIVRLVKMKLVVQNRV